LQKAEPTAQLQDWLTRLVPLAQAARRTLASVSAEKLAMRTGCGRDVDGNFRLALFDEEYIVAPDTFAVTRSATGEDPSPFTQSLILTYLVTADGTTPSGRWVGFRELPNGMFYVRAFQGYSGERLIRELGCLESEVAGVLREAAVSLGGRPLAMGDVGFAFSVLPRVRLAVVYWEGDEEFPSQATVLFEDTAASYMPTDGLAILGSQLVGRLLEAAQATA
jgi:hypothetical protein